MGRRVAALAVAALAVAALIGTARSGAAAKTPTIRMTACKDVVDKKDKRGSYWYCTGVYSFGIPHTAPKMAFLIEAAGFAKGSSFNLNFLDAKTKEPLTSPIRFGPVRYDPGTWRLGFTGPFPQVTMLITVTYQGKQLPETHLFRFT
jgi:hypothetical protein